MDEGEVGMVAHSLVGGGVGIIEFWGLGFGRQGESKLVGLVIPKLIFKAYCIFITR